MIILHTEGAKKYVHLFTGVSYVLLFEVELNYGNFITVGFFF